jgi:DNA primase small subunit
MIGSNMEIDENEYDEMDIPDDYEVDENQETPVTNGEFQLDLEALKMYYQKYFPVNEIAIWLGVNNESKFLFSHREFSFTLPNEAYLRFKSFDDAEGLRRELARLNPIKIDIGAAYNIKPKEKKSVSSGAFVPLERDLVFDIDMDDYDEIRTCCKAAAVCEKCWSFIAVAIQIIDRALYGNGKNY